MTIDTATRILDIAQDLIQKGGYNAFSFNHVAEQVGIKKPSVIHHFPNKPALGVAVVKRYRETFHRNLEAFASDVNHSAMQTFEYYCQPYTDFGETEDKICLCGALAGEFMALPESVQAEVSLFFNEHIQWLESLLKHGKKQGEFSFDDKPNVLAKLILNALQGSLIVKRATQDGRQVQQMITILKTKLLTN